MLNNQLFTQLGALGLHGMAQALSTQLSQSKFAQLGFENRLALLVEAEQNERANKRIDRLLKAAKLRQPNACLEDVDYRPKRSLDPALLNSLATLEWVSRHQGLILTGATGTGKTWLACAFGNQACRNGYSVFFITASQLYEQLICAQIDRSIAKLRRQLVKTQLLIIDDFGIGGVDVQVGQILLDIIDQQSQNGSLLITSQFPVAKWYDFFNDPTVADAILDRIVHRAHNIELKGDSMRKLRKVS